MIIDVHCHHTLTRMLLTVAERFSFERDEPGDRAGDSRKVFPTDFESCVSPRALRRISWRLARRLQGLPEDCAVLDHHLAAEYRRHLEAPGPIDRFVLLAFDAVRDDEGRCVPLPGPGDAFGSDIYTSNSLIRNLCRQHPERFLFGASVHPYRRDAIACIEEVFAAGACLLKWIPLHQNIDVTDPRVVAVLRRCAELGLPLLIHMGDEFSLTMQRRQYRSVRPLLNTLRGLHAEGQMPCVIVAHGATPVLPWGDRHSHRALLAAMTGDLAAAPLYADISALTVPAKVTYLRRLIRRPELHGKLLFGSDFPVPAILFRLWRDLGADYRRLARVASWPQRVAMVCRRLGFDEIVFQRAAELLPHVDYFARKGAAVPA